MIKLTAFLATVLSLIVCLGGVSPALAQEAPQPASRGITTFYVTPEQQKFGVDVYENKLKYDVAIPNPCPLNIEESTIAFFDNVPEAESKAEELEGV